MSLKDEIGNVDTDLIRIRKQRDALNNQNARLTTRLEELEKTLAIVDRVNGVIIDPPSWLAPKKPKSSAATLVVILSDTHFDEVVNAEEMEGLNCYNREIAVMRLEKWTQNVIKLSRHYLSGVTYDGVVVILGGDIFTGDIHEELALTNEDTMIGSLLFWSEQVAAAIGLLTDEFGKCYVTSVVGNHGRTTRKPRMKQRVKTNFDYLVHKYQQYLHVLALVSIAPRQGTCPHHQAYWLLDKKTPSIEKVFLITSQKLVLAHWSVQEEIALLVPTLSATYFALQSSDFQP